MKKVKRLMVDMSMTILHHGHVRLLKKASEIADEVIVGLTTDEEVLKAKHFAPILCYTERKEIAEALCYVDEVVPTPWVITNEVVAENNIDGILQSPFSGNTVDTIQVIAFDRTDGVSSSDLRKRIIEDYLANL